MIIATTNSSLVNPVKTRVSGSNYHARPLCVAQHVSSGRYCYVYSVYLIHVCHS